MTKIAVAKAGPDYSERYDLSNYPIFFMAHIVGQNAENMSSLLARHNLNNSGWRIIASLQYADGLTIKELSKLSVLERSFVSRLVVKLEKMGFVHRDSMPDDDRRVTRAYLTEAGRKIFTTTLLPVVQEQMRRALDGIPAAEIDRFLKTLSRMMMNVYEAANQEPPNVRR